MPEVSWFWPTPSRFDVANITTQGYHDEVTFPMIVRGTPPATLRGVLTLSTCSNVCLLTDYPFSVTPTVQNADFAHDYARAMGKIPLRSGLTDSLDVGYRPGELVVTATRAAGWSSPGLYLDTIDDVDFAKPRLRVEGDRLQATVPVTDSWGEKGARFAQQIADPRVSRWRYRPGEHANHWRCASANAGQCGATFLASCNDGADRRADS